MIAIRLLGTVQVTRDDETVRFESRKAVALVCYLASRAQPVPRAMLAELFWPAKGEREGKNALSRLLYHIGTVAPGAISAGPHTLQLASGPQIWVDAHAFDTLLARQTPAALAEATALYRDEFLADLVLDDCADWELWLVREREGWRQRATEVYERLVAQHLAARATAAGIEVARRWLGLEAWQESAHRALMQMLALSGQRSAAIAQYEICRRVLLEELGAEPDQQTVALFEQISSGELLPLGAAARRTGNLPAQRLTLFGRAGDLEVTSAALRRADVGLLTITGPAGVGKTRLALAIAAQLTGEFPDGVWLVDLAPVEDAELVVPAIARTLGIRTAGDKLLSADLVDALREQRLLLLLDNFEQVLPASGVLAELLDACAGLKLLVTSRVTLPLYAGYEHALEPLAVPQLPAEPPAPGNPTRAPVSHEAIPALAEVPSVALFVQRAQAVQRRFALTAANAASVAAICRRLDGLPLAIELAASRSKLFGPDALLQRLDRRLELLSSPDAGRPPHHRTLRGAIELSYGLLSPAEQSLFQCFAVFAGGATIEAAEQVCSADATTEMVQGLSALVDHSLLQHMELDGEPRLRMLETIREFALSQLDAGVGAAATRRRHALYFLELAEQADRGFDGPDQQAWLDRLAAELDNLRAALDWKPEHAADRRLGLRLATALTRYWWMRDAYGEGRRWLEAQLERNPDAAPEEHALALMSIGRMLESQDQPRARSVLLEALALAPAGGATRTQTLLLLGRIERNLGAYADARAHETEFLALAQQSGDTGFIMMANLSLTDVALDLGEAATAREHATAVLRLTAGNRYPIDRNWAMVQLGRAAALDGDMATARRCFEDGVAQFRRLKLRWGVAEVLCDVGQAAREQGDIADAAECLRECLPLLLELDAWRLVPTCLGEIAAVLEAGGEPLAALGMLGAAEGIHAANGTSVVPARHAHYAALRARLYSSVGAAAEQLLADGRDLSVEQAADLALAALDKLCLSETRV